MSDFLMCDLFQLVSLL